MAISCGNIKTSVIAAACGKAVSGGTEAKVYLVNYADVDKANSTKDPNNSQVINVLDLVDGKRLYGFTSKAKATVGTATFNRGTYFDNFDHSVQIRAFARNQETKDFLNNLVGARVMVIVENVDDGAYTIGADGQVVDDPDQSTKCELYGWDSGLTVSEMPWSTEISDGVVFSVTLASDDNNKEGALPKTILYEKGEADSRITATRLALEALDK